MKLVQRGGLIDSATGAKTLSAIHKKQLALALQHYFGKRISLDRAFRDELHVERFEAVGDTPSDDILYDVWEVQIDTAYVFKPNSVERVPVICLQSSFDPEDEGDASSEWVALAEALNNAPRLDDPDTPITWFIADVPHLRGSSVAQRKVITGFTRPEFLPADGNQWRSLLGWTNRVTEAFAREYADEFPPGTWALIAERVLFESPEQGEPFFRDFAKRFNKKAWEAVSWRSLTPAFVRDFADKLNWRWISRMQAEEVLREHPDRLDWAEVRPRRLSEAFVREFLDQLDASMIPVDDLPEAFIREFFDTLNPKQVSRHPDLSDDFLRQHADQLDWPMLSQQLDLSEAILDEFADRLNWSTVSNKHRATLSFVTRFEERIDFRELSHNRTLHEDVVRQYPSRLNWYAVLTCAHPAHDAAVVWDHLEYLDAEIWDAVCAPGLGGGRYAEIAGAVAAAIAKRR